MIDISKYSKIEVDPKSRCRKITKYKFQILSIILSIIIIILIIVVAIKSKNLNDKTEELSNIDKTLNEMNKDISNIEQKITLFENNKNLLLNDLAYLKNEMSNLQPKYANDKNNYFKLLYKKNDLIAQKEYINNKILYKEKFMKEDEAKTELISKKNLYEKVLQRFNDLSLSNSNILTNLRVFEEITNSKILKKCYDSAVYGFNRVYMFHENCDGHPLLILIKTKKGEKIGAYTSITNEGIKNVKDENSILINFDTNKNYYYYFNIDNKNNKDCVVYSHYDDFPKFGNDFIINTDGKGEYIDNKCYINYGNKYKKLLDEKNFEIDAMEVYKVKAY